MKCMAPDCQSEAVDNNLCGSHAFTGFTPGAAITGSLITKPVKQSLAAQYPKYYKAVPKGIDAIDTYALNQMFPVDDPSGCILHARKKLLVPGVRSGGKSFRKDIQEARDTLNRWLELNPETK